MNEIKQELSKRRVEFHDRKMQKAYEKMGCQGYVNIVYYDYYVKLNDVYRFFTKSGKRYDVNENDIISM
ncbi:hypothetical protein J6S88_06245 [bacterium]|nr:hypothetical protein [bacterium]